MKIAPTLALFLTLAPACRSSAPSASQPMVTPEASSPASPSTTPSAPQPTAPAAQNAADAGRFYTAVEMGQPTVAMPAPPAGLAAATFAGGCFWCMEYAFEHVPGVRDAVSGYTAGPEQHPTYDDVSGHRTQQAESVRVIYDPRVVTYEQLLDVYWRRVDPIHRDQAFVDEGHSYRSVIFVQNAAERAAAERTKQALAASHRFAEPIVTTIEDVPTVFWVAESYHQDFWRTHTEEFDRYHEHSGRREFLRAHWGPDAPY